jgi:hypothetical protein
VGRCRPQEHQQRTVDRPGKVSRSGSYRHCEAAWRWRRRGGLTVLGSEEGGWWPVAAPMSFYGTDVGRRSLGMSQMKKNDTRGGAHRRGRGGGAPARFWCGEGPPVAGDGE